MRYLNIIGLGLLGLLYTSCSQSTGKETAKQEKPADVPVVTVQTTPLSVDHLYVSDIRAIRNVELRNMVAGFLEAIYVDEGQRVKQGQVLFRINSNEYKAEVAKAKAKMNTAKAEARVAEVEYERVKVLTDKDIVSRTELDLASSKLSAANARTEEAKSDLENAQHRLSYTTICAPFDGVVDRIPLKAGSLLTEGTLITSVSDISSMHAYFDVSENEYLKHNRKSAEEKIANKEADLILSDGQAYEYKGKVETVVSEFDASTGSISFRATFPNPKRLLKHKATGKVKLATEMEHALVVPQKATFELQDKTYVYIVGSDNVIKMKSFEPSGRIDQYYIVKSGLSQGDRVVYEGIQDLKDGMKVNPQPIANGGLSVAAFK